MSMLGLDTFNKFYLFALKVLEHVTCNVFYFFEEDWYMYLCEDEEGAFVLAKTMSFTVAYFVDVGEALRLYHTLE